MKLGRGRWTAWGAATRLFYMTRHIVKYCRAQTDAGVASTIALAILLASFAPVLHAASAPVLMVLAHTQAGKEIETKIETKSGLVISLPNTQGCERLPLNTTVLSAPRFDA